MSDEPKRRRGRTKGTIIHYVDPVLKIMRKIAKTEEPRKGAKDKDGKPVPPEAGLYKMYRTMQRDEPSKFLAMLQKLESEHTKAVNETKARVGRMGGSADKCVALVEELLERFKK